MLIYSTNIMSLETFRTLIETMITPEQFAEVLCDDLDLPSSSFSAAIASSIRQQCEQFSGDMIPDDEEDRRVIIKVCVFCTDGQSLTTRAYLFLLTKCITGQPVM